MFGFRRFPSEKRLLFSFLSSFEEEEEEIPLVLFVIHTFSCQVKSRLVSSRPVSSLFSSFLSTSDTAVFGRVSSLVLVASPSLPSSVTRLIDRSTAVSEPSLPAVRCCRGSSEVGGQVSDMEMGRGQGQGERVGGGACNISVVIASYCI